LKSNSPDIVKVRPTSTANEFSNEPGRLDVEVDDRIIVIDGQPDHFWWKGQNIRTFKVGKFAR